MHFPALKAAEEKLTAKQAELAGIFAEAGPDIDMSKVKSLGDSADVVDHVRKLNAELDELGKERDRLAEVGKAAARASEFKGLDSGAEGEGREADAHDLKSVGELARVKGMFKTRNQPLHIDAGVKTLFERAAGWDPEAVRSGLVVLDAQRPVQVTDLFPTIPVTSDAFKYMEETTFTNNAAEKAEGSTYGEAALALTERSVTIEKVTVWLPITDEQLEDEVLASAYVNQRLPFMLRQRVDSQLLVGSGTTPNIRGVNNASSIQTQAKGADPTPDAVYKAMVKVRVTGRAMPNVVIFHPNDWQDVRLLRTVDGIYIWGSPSDPGVERIWGLPVVQSDAQTENTAVVGDFANYSLLAVRRGLDVQVSNSHSTYFVEGKQAIRADVRLASVFTRGEAFCTVTGI